MTPTRRKPTCVARLTHGSVPGRLDVRLSLCQLLICARSFVKVCRRVRGPALRGFSRYALAWAFAFVCHGLQAGTTIVPLDAAPTSEKADNASISQSLAHL